MTYFECVWFILKTIAEVFGVIILLLLAIAGPCSIASDPTAKPRTVFIAVLFLFLETVFGLACLVYFAGGIHS